MAGKRRTKSSLSRDSIMASALELIDTRGLDAFTIRNLADSLKVFPTALYWYYPARIDIIEAVVQRVLSGIVPRASDDWRVWLRAFAHNLRNAVAKHPNVAPLIGGQLVSNTSADLEMIEAILGMLNRAGYEGPSLVPAYNMFIGALVGFVTQEFAGAAGSDESRLHERIEQIARQIDADDHPLLHTNSGAMLGNAFILRWVNGTERPMIGGFEMLVETLVAGLAAGVGRAQTGTIRDG
ncbi:TetR/AcrR family transcriptional regulator [Pararhodobacter zhoushanensis]|uniref:TetR/AcrR family transcriptional regulator C-terminal domain-containing protein n=1 Tax=Pararhodobacter zhoushanensis TaxID=2479545 RepID=A0ABT3H5D2_9RHOB|nr:TetR/AcrR family transcriptional regulator C-terminal domain-containing protein [Pararhodobacter zhoushanensis]MCW1935015.1 TetR/AcrR family transcriptional regulator C-terminal domain-containing protein [Pararhodobacter zhoushanensis]